MTEYMHFIAELYGDSEEIINTEADRMIAVVKSFIDELKDSALLWRRHKTTAVLPDGGVLLWYRFSVCPPVNEQVIADFSRDVKGIKKELLIYNFAQDSVER